MAVTRACPCCGFETSPPTVWPRYVVWALVICGRCGSILKDYRDRLVEPEPDEFAALDASPAGAAVRAVQREVFARMGSPRCPWCGSVPRGPFHDIGGTATPPSEGQAWVCAACHQVAAFDNQGHLRKPTVDQAAEFAASDVVARAIEYLRQNRPGPPPHG